MHVRVVRFTDVSRERIDGLAARIQDGGDPPPGVPPSNHKLFFDEQQGTAVVVQSYASAEDMAAADKAFDAMDAGDTPGTRVSVDRGELLAEADLG